MCSDYYAASSGIYCTTLPLAESERTTKYNIHEEKRNRSELNADDGEGDGDAAPVTDNGQGGFAIATETEGGQLKVDRRRR